MTFHRVPPNAHYRALRLQSGGGVWELGISPYSHGMRMRMGPSARPPRTIDFCMGRDPGIFPRILLAILARLEPLHENVCPEEVDAVFPWHGTRPDMNLHLSALLLSPSGIPSGRRGNEAPVPAASSLKFKV